MIDGEDLGDGQNDIVIGGGDEVALARLRGRRQNMRAGACDAVCGEHVASGEVEVPFVALVAEIKMTDAQMRRACALPALASTQRLRVRSGQGGCAGLAQHLRVALGLGEQFFRVEQRARFFDQGGLRGVSAAFGINRHARGLRVQGRGGEQEGEEGAHGAFIRGSGSKFKVQSFWRNLSIAAGF